MINNDMASVAMLGVKGGPAIYPGSHMPTSLLVKMAGLNIVIDAGLGVTRGICNQGTMLDDIDLIIITHLHSDHYLELGPLLHTAWTAGLNKQIRIIGPTDLKAYWQHFIMAMQFDIDLRIHDEGRCALEPLASFQTLDDGTIFDSKGLNISAMRNDHPPIEESFALSLTSGDKKLVFSGDTAFMPKMADFAASADILIHEAMLPEGIDALCAGMANGDERLRKHLQQSHTSAQDAGKVATLANIKHLVLTHFVPGGATHYPDQSWTDAARQTWDGPLTIAKDGMVLKF